MFGKAPEWSVGSEFVYTYSIAQIMSKANAASVLAAGIRQFITEPDAIPFVGPIGVTDPKKVLERLDPTKPTAIDIETDGLLGKAHTPEEVNVISIAFYQAGQPPIVLVSNQPFEVYGRTGMLTHGSIYKLLQKFEKPIYHNGKFDIRVFNGYFGIKLTNWFDTMLAHHVINMAAGDHKLKTLARRYLGAPEWEVGLNKYTKQGGHYELIPYAELINYNGWDVYWTYKLWEFLEPQIEADENNQTAFMLEMAEAEFLLEVEQNGIPFNNQYAEEYGNDLEAAMRADLIDLRLLLEDENYNPNSPQQVKKVLESYGWKVLNTEAETLESIERLEDSDGDKFIKMQLEFKKLSKIKGTYIDGWKSKERQGRVHPTFLVHGTTTGRLSSTQPNAQNMPRDKSIRKLIAVNE